MLMVAILIGRVDMRHELEPERRPIAVAPLSVDKRAVNLISTQSETWRRKTLCRSITCADINQCVGCYLTQSFLGGI